jgi:gas vesicle protein
LFLKAASQLESEATVTHENGNGGTLMAFLMGIITGAAVALLYAPGPGESTRRQLSARAKDARDRAKEVGDIASEAARDAARQSREFVNRQRDTISTAVERGKEAYERARGSSEPYEPSRGTTGFEPMRGSEEHS